MIKVSIVIPTYQRCDSLKRLLTALNAQSFPQHEFEVIVSIDGSEDGSKEMIDNFKAPYLLRYIWERNRGKAAACNSGIRAASSDLVIILDDDMEPSAELVGSHYAAHQIDPHVCIVGAAPIKLDPNASPTIGQITDKFNTHLEKLSRPDYNLRIWDFYGGNFSIRKSVITEVGLFDESYKSYGYEDVEFAYRLLNRGIKIIFNPYAMCIQHYDDDFKGLAYKTINSGKNAVQLVNLHPDTFNELKLIEYNYTGWKWRSLRLFLIWTSMLIPPASNLIISIISKTERKNIKVFERLFSLAMDYFFWLGVWTALRNDKNRKQLIAKIKSGKKPQICPTL
ncbi:MAG: glycosyltransferase [Thermodesulfobacteriota bacterium]